MRYKYPRTHHLPWSLGATDDDKTLSSDASFQGKEVIVSEKMDGESATLYSDYYHARSLDSASHPSQSWLRQFHAGIRHQIPEAWRVCGENLYAEHSISYELPTYFLAFSIWERERCFSWDDTVECLNMLGIQHVPILYRGLYDAHLIKKCYTGVSQFGGTQEGYVVRLASEFTLAEFPEAVAKFVRAQHVQTDTHWTRCWKPNKLKNL